MGAAFAAQEKAIAAALAAVKEATERFAAAFESRMANTNEWRQSVDDKDRLFMPRKEAEAISEALKEKIDTLTLSFREQRSNSSGVSVGWAMAVGVVGLIGIIVSIVSFFLRREGGGHSRLLRPKSLLIPEVGGSDEIADTSRFVAISPVIGTD